MAREKDSRIAPCFGVHGHPIEIAHTVPGKTTAFSKLLEICGQFLVLRVQRNEVANPPGIFFETLARGAYGEVVTQQEIRGRSLHLYEPVRELAAAERFNLLRVRIQHSPPPPVCSSRSLLWRFAADAVTNFVARPEGKYRQQDEQKQKSRDGQGEIAHIKKNAIGNICEQTGSRQRIILESMKRLGVPWAAISCRRPRVGRFSRRTGERRVTPPHRCNETHCRGKFLKALLPLPDHIRFERL